MARSHTPRPSAESSLSITRRGAADGDALRTVVWVRGEHDTSTKDALAIWLATAALLDDDGLIVDLSGVTFMDASIVRTLAAAAQRLHSRSQSLALRAPSHRAARVLEICGVAYPASAPPAPAFHPSGVAAAISTWVEVPRTDANPLRTTHAAATVPDRERAQASP